MVLANSKLVKAGENANLPMVHEVFADRAEAAKQRAADRAHGAAEETEDLAAEIEEAIRRNAGLINENLLVEGGVDVVELRLP